MNSFFVNSGFVCGYFGQFPSEFGPVVSQLSVAFRGDASLAEQWLTRMEKEAPLDSLRTLEKLRNFTGFDRMVPPPVISWFISP